jgi:hypothetical protein
MTFDQRKPRKPLKKSWIKRGTKELPKVNVRQQAKRKKVYAAALRSAHWKALKKQVYEEQGGLCICGQEPMTILDHLHYQRLGHELRSDVQGLGDVCNARETTSKRANWMGGPRRGS